MHIILYFILFTFASCASRPVANVHHERIETHLQPIPVAADTIEFTMRHTAPTTSIASTTVDRRLLTVDNIKSTRALNIKSRHTDTTQTLRITLRPDTVYLPYTTHIRSDTIIAPDPTTAAKLTSARWQMLVLILIIIVATIISILKNRMTRLISQN